MNVKNNHEKICNKQRISKATSCKMYKELFLFWLLILCTCPTAQTYFVNMQHILLKSLVVFLNEMGCLLFTLIGYLLDQKNRKIAQQNKSRLKDFWAS